MQTSTADSTGQGQLKFNDLTSNWLKNAPSFDSNGFNRDLVVWFCRDLLPFSAVGKCGFSGFMQKNLPDMSLPDRTTLSHAALHDVYDAVKMKVTEDLKGAETLCVMFDGWTDKYHRRHFLGIRVKIIRPDWSPVIITLSSNACEAQDAAGMVDHILRVMSKFLTDEELRNKTIFTTHDGAEAMKKASTLLHSQGFTHCLAHVLHLLIMVDSIKNVRDLMGLVKKSKNMVNKLHYKGCLLKEEAENEAETAELESLLQMIEDAKMEQEAEEDVICLEDDVEHEKECETDDSDCAENAATSRGGKAPAFTTLKNEVETRWNSTFSMLESLTKQTKIVDKTLRRIGEPTLQKQEWQVLTQVKDFLKNFQSLTEMVSGETAELSLIPLIKAEIKTVCQPDSKDCEELKTLKKNILKNLDKRIPLTESVLQAALLDPAMKDLEILSLDHTKKVKLLKDLHSSLPKATQNSSTSSEEAADAGDLHQSTAAVPEANLNKRQKLLLKHSGTSSQQKLEHEIESYLATKADPMLNPLEFWAQNNVSFPNVAQCARYLLSRNAASVPVEALFSTMGLILNSRRSSLAPYRANEIIFIHDNFDLYF